MRKRPRSVVLGATFAFVCAIWLAAGSGPASAADDPRTVAKSAQDGSAAAADLSKVAAQELTSLESDATVHAALAKSLDAANEACDLAAAAAQLAVELANLPAGGPNQAAVTADALAAAHGAEAGAKLAAAAVQNVRASIYLARVKLKIDPGDAKAAADCSKIAAQAVVDATEFRSKAAADGLALKNLGATASPLGREALAVAGKVPTPPKPAAAATPASFKLGNTKPFNLTYKLDRRNDVVSDGKPDDDAQLELDWTQAGQPPPPRITVVLSFPFQKLGKSSIPESARLRILPTRNKYTASKADLATIAYDFVNAKNKAASYKDSEIGTTSVTVTVLDDDGNPLAVLTGALQIVALPVN